MESMGAGFDMISHPSAREEIFIRRIVPFVETRWPMPVSDLMLRREKSAGF